MLLAVTHLALTAALHLNGLLEELPANLPSALARYCAAVPRGTSLFTRSSPYRSVTGGLAPEQSCVPRRTLVQTQAHGWYRCLGGAERRHCSTWNIVPPEGRCSASQAIGPRTMQHHSPWRDTSGVHDARIPRPHRPLPSPCSVAPAVPRGTPILRPPSGHFRGNMTCAICLPLFHVEHSSTSRRLLLTAARSAATNPTPW